MKIFFLILALCNSINVNASDAQISEREFVDQELYRLENITVQDAENIFWVITHKYLGDKIKGRSLKIYHKWKAKEMGRYPKSGLSREHFRDYFSESLNWRHKKFKKQVRNGLNDFLNFGDLEVQGAKIIALRDYRLNSLQIGDERRSSINKMGYGGRCERLQDIGSEICEWGIKTPMEFSSSSMELMTVHQLTFSEENRLIDKLVYNYF